MDMNRINGNSINEINAIMRQNRVCMVQVPLVDLPREMPPRRVTQVVPVLLPPVPFDRRLRDQIVVADLVSALFYGMVANDLPGKSRVVLQGINARVKKIQDALYHGADRLILRPKNYRKYMRILTRLRRAVHEMYGERVPLDFYNAVMMMVFDVVEDIQGHRSGEYVAHWQRLAEMMEKLYLHMEGDVMNEKWIMDGQETRRKFERIVEVA